MYSSAQVRLKSSLLLLFLMLSATAPARIANLLKAQNSNLRFVPVANRDFVLQLSTGTTLFEQKTPLALEIVDDQGTARWIFGTYQKVAAHNGAVDATGEVLSPHGTHFLFFDRFARAGDGFQLQRRVEVALPSPHDVGFATRFGFAWAQPETTRDGDVLMPGAWYLQNQNVPPRAFAANIDFQVLMYREDRLGLPLVAFRDRKSGMSLIVERAGGQPTTFAGEEGNKRFIDERFQVGALGFLNTGCLEVTFAFPGSEDERPLLNSHAPSSQRWLPRSHPVRRGVRHAYTVHFEAGKTASFAAMVETTTKAAIARAMPPLVQANLGRVYRASMDLLNAVIQPYNGTVSVPFQVGVPGGEIKDTSMQMGFVGMALPCASLLLRDGLETRNARAVERATRVVDFWVQQSPEPSGVPKTWADFPTAGQVTWRHFPTHLRIASDGMRGVLQAWEVARRHGLDKPQWLQFARNFGNFLAEHQNADGSWFGSWNFDGTPHDHFTNATTHPLEFLIDLTQATGDRKYQQAALRAGEFCLKTVHQQYSYVGGTPDNPNVTDKEAGVLAMQGFLALFDATGEHQWLEAARQAAVYCETWVYWRDLPMPSGNATQVFPGGRTTVGLSLIATGHAGADNFMALAPFAWYRLYLLSGDTHFLQTARWLLHDTKQIMDWDGKLGYKYPGLLPEAMSLSTPRGSGVAGWLPWLTFVIAEPLVQLQDTFGSMDIDQIERLPHVERLRRNARFSHTRGFGLP